MAEKRKQALQLEKEEEAMLARDNLKIKTLAKFKAMKQGDI